MVAHDDPLLLSDDEYLALDQSSDVRHEFIDGYVYAMSGGTLDHDAIGGNVRTALHIALRASPGHASGCRVYGPDARVRLGPRRYAYPDAVVTCHAGDRGDKLYVEQPQVILEVLSESTEAYDRGKKMLYYQACPSVREYVLVNTRLRRVEVYERDDGLWTYRAYEDAAVLSLSSTGIDIALAEIYLDVEVPPAR